MPLITSTTSLNKLKFGSGNAGDRFDNGFSNQPYITTDIPGVNVSNSNPTPITELDSSGAPIYGDVTPGSLDILFRGGLNAIKDSITDVSRLTKMFFDTKSPNGLIFIANQNLLSRTSVMTEASYGIGYGRDREPDFITGKGGGALPSGIYLPSSTIAQAAVNFSGTHLNLMGLDPTSPNSRTGETSGISSLFGGTGPGAGLRTYSMVMNDKIQIDAETTEPLSNRLFQIYNNKQKIGSATDPDVIVYQGGPGSILGIGKTRIRFAGSNGTGTTRTGINNLGDNNTIVWDAAQLSEGKTISAAGRIGPDFRKKLIDVLGPGGVPLTGDNAQGIPQTSILSISPSYIDKNKDNRTEMGDAGANFPKVRNNPNVGRLNYGIAANEMVAIDKINAQTMYVASGPNPDKTLAVNDFCKFRIAAIDNSPDAGGNAVYMHFRAFIDGFSDSYNSSWNPTKFSGRGDSLYTYAGFTRDISLSFTVYAQSKAELIPMYKKLNYLASTMAPDYNAAGFMRGNLVRLTLGGYLYEQPGFISSFTYEAPQESSWEIAINENGESDPSVKELPFMIKVSGMTFTPIQDFLPRKISPNAANGMEGEQMIDERYIALSNKIGDSLYRDEYVDQKSTLTNYLEENPDTLNNISNLF
jgi:hypothetical protein